VWEGRYREVRYEQLVGDAEGTLRSLCAFAGLRFDPAMTLYYENEALLSERSWFRPVSLPRIKGLRNWRKDMAPRDVALFEALAGDTLRNLGYEPSEFRRGTLTAGRAWGKWSAVQARRPLRRLRHLRFARGRASFEGDTDQAGRIPAS
jgi:hypothetical protein